MRISNDVAAKALTAIQNKKGKLTADAVVEAARSPKHPLHDYFEWDDAKAGQANRLAQARVLIASIHIETTSTDVAATVAYVRDPSAEGNEQGYIATVVLADDGTQAREAVASELRLAIAYLRRAGNVAQSVSVPLDVEGIIKKVEALAATLTQLVAA